MNLFAWGGLAAVVFLAAWGLNRLVKIRAREKEVIRKGRARVIARIEAEPRDDSINLLRRSTAHPSDD